jgi:hypothetical protein
MGVSHLSGLQVAGVPTMGIAGLPAFFTGNYWFVDPVKGSDGNSGSASNPFQTLAQAQAQAVADNDDVVLFKGGGAATGAGSAYQSSTLLWAKNQVHLIGMCSPGMYGKRARIAPTSSLAGTAGFNQLVKVTGAGCLFANLQSFYGFSNTAAALVNWEDDGGRSTYLNCEFLGFGDNTTTTGTANLTGARAIKLNNNVGETTFVNCVFGGNTTTRNATNYTMEIAGGCPRVIIRDSVFDSLLGSSGGASSHILIGNNGIDRELVIEGTAFLSSVLSGGTAMAQAFNVSATAGGGVLARKGCTSFGVTAWETTPSNSVFIDMGAVSAPGGGKSLVL